MKLYDIALCRFNDLLEISKYSSLRNLITLKIAECFAHSDFEEAKDIFNSLSKLKNKEIDMHINKLSINKQTKNKNYIKIERYTSNFAIDESILYSRMNEIVEETNHYSDVKI